MKTTFAVFASLALAPVLFVGDGPCKSGLPAGKRPGPYSSVVAAGVPADRGGRRDGAGGSQAEGGGQFRLPCRRAERRGRRPGDAGGAPTRRAQVRNV